MGRDQKPDNHLDPGPKLHTTIEYKYRISSINTAFSISTPVRYYLNTNNIETIVIFISSAPWIVPHAT